MILDYANSGEFSYTEYENVRQIMVVPVEDYNRIMGTDETLDRQEVLVCNTKTDWQENYQELILEGMGTWKIEDQVEFVDNGVNAMQIIPTTYLFVSDVSVMEEMYQSYPKAGEEFEFWNYYGTDLDCSDETQSLIAQEISAGLQSLGEQDPAFFFRNYCRVCRGRADGFLFYVCRTVLPGDPAGHRVPSGDGADHVL